MDATDQYFTQTIVGTPLTVLLGFSADQSVWPGVRTAAAIEVDAHSAKLMPSQSWRDLMVLPLTAPLGKPWRRPGRVRSFLLRYSMSLMVGGWLVAAALALVAWLPKLLALHG